MPPRLLDADREASVILVARNRCILSSFFSPVLYLSAKSVPISDRPCINGMFAEYSETARVKAFSNASPASASSLYERKLETSAEAVSSIERGSNRANDTNLYDPSCILKPIDEGGTFAPLFTMSLN